MFDALTRSLAHPEALQNGPDRRCMDMPCARERRLAERRGDAGERADWLDMMRDYLKKYL
jgi:hypothetical protein